MVIRVSLALIVFCGIGVPGWVHSTEVRPSNPAVEYVGRWDRTLPDAPWAQAQGSALHLSFTGSAISAIFQVVEEEYFRVIVDGDGETSRKIEPLSGEATVLASGLDPGAHTVKVIKETDHGRATVLGLAVDDGETVSAPPQRPSRRIVFYGDSNLAGYSLESERNQDGWDLVGTHYGYAGVTARMFGAEYQNISRSGATIAGLRAAFARVDWNTDEPRWDFSAHQTDVVVVNIGANDSWRPKEINKARYHRLLDSLRKAHPSAHIALFNAYGWDSSEPASYTHEVVAEREDTNLSAAVFPWVFERFHGCQTDHAGMAVILAEHLSTVTGWEAGPSDVVSGFGVGGNVANGSFEDSAPFGGWGWRYFDDGGVERAHDPDGSRHGNHHLRLVDGARSHQTNPASNGDAVTVSFWARGDGDRQELEVRLSFRDQDGGGEPNPPLSEHVEIRVLTKGWKYYSASATAPEAGPNPVFSVRVAFVAGLGHSVEIDEVVMGPSSPSPRSVARRVEP